MKIKLPLKFKKQIIDFCKEYEELARPRLVEFEIPKHVQRIKVCWASDSSIETQAYDLNDIDLESVFHNSKTANNINRKIKNFIKRTETFGKKHFDCKDWLWYEILWNYQPERNDTFGTLRIEWVKDYEYNN